MKKILFLILGVILFTSCKNLTTKDYVSSKMPLRQLVKSVDTSKQSRGSYFLIAASFQSSEVKVTKVKMYVLAEGIYSYQEYNISDVKIKIDDTIKIPYLYINYKNTQKLNDLTILDPVNQLYITPLIVLVCPEKYLPEQLLPININ